MRKINTPSKDIPKQEYRNVHRWARRNVEHSHCAHCGIDGLIDCANVSGQYLRDPSDWIALCRKCHRAFDREDTCPRGHPRIPENLKPNGDRFKCRPCTNETWKTGYYRRKDV